MTTLVVKQHRSPPASHPMKSPATRSTLTSIYHLSLLAVISTPAAMMVVVSTFKNSDPFFVTILQRTVLISVLV